MLHSLEGPLPLHRSDSSTDHTPSPLTCAAAIPATRPSNVYKEIINYIREIVRLACGLLRHNQRVGTCKKVHSLPYTPLILILYIMLVFELGQFFFSPSEVCLRGCSILFGGHMVENNNVPLL